MHHVFYHRADLDGIASGFIVLKALEVRGIERGDIKLCPYDYGDQIPTFRLSDDYYMVDMSFPKEEMIRLHALWETGQVNVTWIDHHKTSLRDAMEGGYNNLPGVRTDGLPAACAIAWNFFFKEKLPPGIDLLSLYDTWQDQRPDWKDTILPYQYGMRQMNFGRWLLTAASNTCFFTCVESQDCLNLIESGSRILSYQESQNAIHAKRAFLYEWKGVKFACLNQGEINSQCFNSISFPYDACMSYRYNGSTKKWKFSLYGVSNPAGKEIDLSVIAKEMGGGGHAKACGFEVNMIQEVFAEHYDV